MRVVYLRGIFPQIWRKDEKFMVNFMLKAQMNVWMKSNFIEKYKLQGTE